MNTVVRIKRIAVIGLATATLAAGGLSASASAQSIVTSQPGASSTNQLGCAYAGSDMATGEGQMKGASAAGDAAGVAAGAIQQMHGITSAASSQCQITRI